MLHLWYAIAALQLLIWGIVFRRLARYQPPAYPAVNWPPVSIIICARNEARNLQQNLAAVLQQDYPTFEVLVVDDASEEATPRVLQALQQQYAHLRVLRVTNKTRAGKKSALAKGIAAACHEHLLLTDADCRPASRQWLRRMAQTAVAEGKALVLGYGPYWPAPTWLNRWVQFETVFVLLQYGALALWGQPYMGVGRNLWYQKRLFEDAGGFERHADVISGDDDLLVNAVATGHNTALCLHPESFMFSDAPSTWRRLYQQKTRHYASSGHYQWHHQVLLAALSGSQFFFYVGLLGIMAGNAWNCGIIVLIIARSFLVLLVYYRLLHTLRQKALWPYVLLLDAAWPLYYLIFAAAALGATQPTTWNRR